MAIYRHDIFIFILETDKNRRLQCDYNNGKCPKVGALSICCLSCRQFVKCPFREKKSFYKILIWIMTVCAIDAA